MSYNPNKRSLFFIKLYYFFSKPIRLILLLLGYLFKYLNTLWKYQSKLSF